MQKIIFLLFFLAPCVWVAGQQALEDSLTKVIAANTDPVAVARAYNGLAYEYTRKDPVKSRACLEASIAISKRQHLVKIQGASYAQLVYQLYDSGKPDSASYYLELLRQLVAGGSGSEKDSMNADYYSVAAMFYKKTGHYLKAIPFFEKSIALHVKTGNKESRAGQTLNLGNTFTALGNYRQATRQHLQSLALFEELGSDRGMSFCYQSLSESFTQLKEYERAMSYANKSIQLKTALHDRRGIGTAESGMGNIYFGLGEYEKALSHYKTAVGIAREIKLLTEEQDNYEHMAKVYAAQKDVAGAIDYYGKSKVLAKQLHDTSAMLAIEAELIALQNNIGKNDSAELQLKKGIELFQQRGDLNRQAAGFKNMVDFYTAGKQFEKALAYNNKYYQAVDSLRSNELLIQVRNLEEQYTVEKKEKEIVLLKKDRELQQQKLYRQQLLFAAAAALLGISLLSILLFINRNRLRQQMKELKLRNQIAADLHDEVGSSLSSIHLLSQMATSQSNEVSQKSILEKMSSNARETMDKMGDIVWMIQPGTSDAANLQQRMERFAFEICGSKNITANLTLGALDKLVLSMEQRKNIYLIFKEAVNNAVKYSGTEKIDVTALLHNRQLTLTVKDFGRGFDPALVKHGNGLNNMQYRAKELGGKLTSTTARDAGSTVELIVSV